MMTYASQLRTSNKYGSQTSNDEINDFHSLRIICRYFVGSIVKVKTKEEQIEGLLHTLHKNKICLSLVTCSDSITPEKISNMSNNRIIQLNDIMSISISENSQNSDVSFKDQVILNTPVESTNNSKVPSRIQSKHGNQTKFREFNSGVKFSHIIQNNLQQKKHLEDVDGDKMMLKCNGDNSDENKKKPTNLEPNNDSRIITEINKNEEELSDIQKENTMPKTIENEENIKCSNDTIVDNSLNNDKSCKKFTFNPNAPEFKPRSQINSKNNVSPASPSVIFPPPLHVHSPSINDINTLSPSLSNTSSALFVPNYILFDSRQYSSIINNSSDISNRQQNIPWSAAINMSPSNIPSSSISSSITTSVTPTEPQPILSNMPFYSPISIFVPNSSIVPLSSVSIRPPRSINISESSDDGSKQHYIVDNNYKSPSNNCDVNVTVDKIKSTPKSNENNINNSSKNHKLKDNELSNPNIWPPLPEPTKPLINSTSENTSSEVASTTNLVSSASN